jgi:hypothetical protein
LLLTSLHFGASLASGAPYEPGSERLHEPNLLSEASLFGHLPIN